MSSTPRITSRRFAELFVVALVLIFIWLVAGLFTASEFYRRSIAMRGELEKFFEIVMVQMVTSLNWAFYTPFLIALAERLPLRKPVLLRNVLILSALLPAIGLIRSIHGSVVMNLGEHHHVSMDFMRLSVAIRLHRYIAIGALIIVVTNLVMAQREVAERGRRELAAKTLLARAELDGLRAQMQPHFLFLTLQTIADVVHRDPATADDMIVGLSDLLRRSLTLGNEPVPLFDELDFVDRTLALYAACFDGRLAIRFDAGEDVLSARVPPLLVQQLVENAVVQGIAPAGGGAIEVRGWRDGDQLRLEVRDGGAASRDEEGLVPIRVRLERLFEDAELTVRSDANGFVAAVAIPLDLMTEPGFPADELRMLEAV
jgi:two-component system LytT family sensor kinase